MFKRTLALVLFFLIAAFSPSAFSQEKEAEAPHWKGDVAVGFSLARGNSNASNFSFSFSADGQIGRALSWENKGVYLFGAVDGRTSAESGLVASRLTWRHSPRFLSYYELQVLRDRFKNFSSRVLPAVGIGYKVIAGKDLQVLLDAGIGGVSTKFYDTGETMTYGALKLGQGLVWAISETAEINEKLELSAKLSELGRYFFRWETNLVAALAKSWTVKLTFIDSYDNKPLGPDVEKNDIALIASLSRKF